jgi:ribonuclease P protein component
MLPKKNKADKKILDDVFQRGSFLVSPHLTFKYVRNNNQKSSRISFVVPKSLYKSAVKRNQLRRFGYRVLGKYTSSIPGTIAGVFIFKSEPKEEELNNELKVFLNKIN